MGRHHTRTPSRAVAATPTATPSLPVPATGRAVLVHCDGSRTIESDPQGRAAAVRSARQVHDRLESSALDLWRLSRSHAVDVRHALNERKTRQLADMRGVRAGIDDQAATRLGQNAERVRVDRKATRVLFDLVLQDVRGDLPLAAGRHVDQRARRVAAERFLEHAVAAESERDVGAARTLERDVGRATRRCAVGPCVRLQPLEHARLPTLPQPCDRAGQAEAALLVDGTGQARTGAAATGLGDIQRPVGRERETTGVVESAHHHRLGSAAAGECQPADGAQGAGRATKYLHVACCGLTTTPGGCRAIRSEVPLAASRQSPG